MTSEMDHVISEYIAECQEMIQRVNERLSSLEHDASPHETIRAISRDIHTIKGNSQMFGFLQVGQISHSMEECLQKYKETSSGVTPPLIDLLLEGMDVIAQLFASIKATSRESTQQEVVTAICQKLAKLSDHMAPKNQVTHVQDAAAIQSQNAIQEVVQKTKQIFDEGPTDTIRVQIELLDKLMNLTGELVLIRNQLSQIAKFADNENMNKVSQRLQVISSELQNDVMKTRMQPIGNILGKFNRIVRDTARNIGKSAELFLSGTETELDKSLIEAVRDPLTHLIRNAVDHGIESPADRKKAGKSESGNISIRAYHEGGHVNIEIRDDGRGLSRMKIGSKALERGLITPEVLARLSDREIYNFIFYPGFSTALKVSNLSGRGVGMDVVRTNIEKIGGSIDIMSTAGKGTTVKLRIPLTLAIIPALVVRSGRQCFAIPQVNLAELIQLRTDNSAHQIEFLQGQPVYRLRGHLLPLLHLGNVLLSPKDQGASSEPASPSLVNRQPGDSVTVAILNTEDRFFGLIVDEIEGSADIVVKPIPTFIKDLGAFSGATILGDGDIALTLDVGGIAERSGLRQHEPQGTSSKDFYSASGRTFQEVSHEKKPHPAEFLRVGILSKSAYGIPLESVMRLEEIPSSDVQISGEQKVVKYRGSLLPLVSISKVLGLTQDWPVSEKIPVIVVHEKSRLYGLVVKNIFDIFSSHDRIDREITQSDGLLGSLIHEGEVITMIDPPKIIQRHFASHLTALN